MLFDAISVGRGPRDGGNLGMPDRGCRGWNGEEPESAKGSSVVPSSQTLVLAVRHQEFLEPRKGIRKTLNWTTDDLSTFENGDQTGPCG